MSINDPIRLDSEHLKPNCLDCIHHRTIPGDAHLECKHPRISEIDSLLSPLLLMQGIIPPAMKLLAVTGNETGIRKGWFAWPLNFDPVWLESCDGFTEKENKMKTQNNKEAIQTTNAANATNATNEKTA